MTSAQAVCETRRVNDERDSDELLQHHRAIREETVVLDILAQAAEIEVQQSGVLTALRRAVGFGGGANEHKGTLYVSQSHFQRGRHERPNGGRHTLDYVESVTNEPVRPVVPRQRNASSTPYVPKHRVVAKQQDTVMLPVVSGRLAQHRKEAVKTQDTWRVAVAGLGAAAVACVGLTASTAKGPGGGGEAAITYIFTPDTPGTGSANQEVSNTGVTTSPAVPTERRPEAPSRAMSRHEPKPTPTLPPVTTPDKKPVVSGLTGTQQKIVQTYAQALQTMPAKQREGVCQPAIVAQAATVSSWGTSQAARQHNNPFGLKDNRGNTVHYTSLQAGIAAQVKRITSSPYYRDSRFFPGQPAASCAVDGRTFVLMAPTNKAVRTNLIFKYFRQKGLNDEQIAGMVGNFVRESGVNPSTIQKAGGSARGLAQWEGSRWSGGRGLKTFAAKRGKQWTDLHTQLDFTWYELTGTEKRAHQALKQTKTATQATYTFAKKFERPNPTPKSIRMDIRVQGALKAHKEQTVRKEQVNGSLKLMKRLGFGSLFAKRPARR